MIAKKHFFKMMLFLLVSFSLSCSHFTSKVIEAPYLQQWVSSSDAPKVIAILPFTNETKKERLDQLVRESFYESFSVRHFHDVEIKEIDATIKMLEEREGKDFHKIPSKKLGELLRCDALVYGRVTKYKRIFLLVYTQMLIEAEIRIVEAQSGKELWKNSFAKRFHEGGMPTNPFGAIPTAIRTIYSLRESKRNRDIDAFCKDFVSFIPKIQDIQTRRIYGLYEEQLPFIRTEVE